MQFAGSFAESSETGDRKPMKLVNVMIGLAVTGMVLSAVSTEAQLDLSGGTVVGSLNETLVGFSPVSDQGMNNGSISTWVVSDTAAGSLDKSGLIFVYQVVNNGPDAIDEVELTGFNNSQVLGEGVYTSVTGITGASPAGSGAYFNSFVNAGGAAFFQGGNLAQGNSASDYLVIFTDASAFGLNYGQEEDNFSAEGDIYAPVPEASTVLAGISMILPLGVGIFRALRKNRLA